MKEQRIQWIVFGIALINTMGISAVLPVIPLLADAFTISPERAVLAIASFVLPGFFLIPLMAVFADRQGRKVVLLPALILFIGGGIASACAPSFTWLLVARFIQGIGAAPFSMLYNTIVADTWHNEEKVRMMGLSGMMLGFGTAFSPALGGILGMAGWRWPFLTCLAAIPVLWLSLSVSFSRPVVSGTITAYLKDTWHCLQAPGTKTLLCVVFVTFVILGGAIIACLPLLATQKFTATPFAIGMVIASCSLAAGLIASRLSLLYRHFSPRILLMAGQCCYCCALVLVPLIPSMWGLFLPITLYGLGQGLTVPLTASLLTGQAQKEQQAALMGLNAMVLRLGQTLGVIMFSTLAEWQGVHSAFAAGAILAVIMVCILFKAPLPAIARREDSEVAFVPN